MMIHLTVELPTDLVDFVEAKAQRLGLSSASEYVCRLIEQDQREQALHDLECKISAGLSSRIDGKSKKMTQTDWAQLKRDMVQRRS